jgi:hypothetical protein
MVCYSSMSPLPSSTSILCSSSASFCFYALLFFLLHSQHPLFSFSSTFYALCASACYTLHLFSAPFLMLTTTFYAHASVPENHILCMSLSRQVLCQIILATLHHHSSVLHLNSIYILFYVLHVIFSPSSLPGPHCNSATLLAVTHCLFIISAHYPEIPFLH